MGKYAGQGDTALTLAEECAEVIQIITKMKRFGGNWDEVPPGKDKTRWQMLEEEMNDLLRAWDWLSKEQLSEADYWDGDNSASE
jgi:NTP pyrophosphatase (non-canonical NTP hydrolase)